MRIATTELVVACPDERLNAALRAFAQAGVGRLPVVERANPRGLVDVLRRAEGEQRGQPMRLGSHSGAPLAELVARPGRLIALKEVDGSVFQFYPPDPLVWWRLVLSLPLEERKLLRRKAVS